MNETDPLILYTDASTVSIGGVLMQEQYGIEKPIIFISHILSGQATRWGIMELELYAFVYCVKQLTPCLMGKLFTVKTDHKNLVYLSNSSIPKLVRWRVLLSEFRFLVQHIRACKTWWQMDSLKSLVSQAWKSRVQSVIYSLRTVFHAFFG